MKFQLNENQGRHILRAKLGKARLDVYPGHVVDDKDWVIPAGMKSDFTPLEPIPVQPPKLQFTLQSLPGGFFHVIHPVTKKAINSKRLTKHEAEFLAGKTVEQYDAELLAAEEAVKKEQDDKKQALIEKIMAGEECPFTLEVLMAKSLAELEQIEDSEDDRLAALANTKSGGAGSGK